MTDLFETMAQRRRENRPFALCTIVAVELSAPRDVGARMVVFEDGGFVGTIGGGPLEHDVVKAAVDRLAAEAKPAKLAIALEQYPEMRCGGTVEVFIDVVLPQPRLIVVGAGHIGHHVARLAEVLQVPHVVADDRPHLATRERFPAAQRIVVADPDRAPFDDIGVTRWDCIVIVSRAYDYDELCLEAALRTPARYVGMMGSRRKVGGTIAKLEARGLPVRGDSRVRLPIGLDLGDKSPPHIAFGIVAEVLQAAYGTTARPLSWTVPEPAPKGAARG